ncbi:hypothetical protein Tco_0447997 [Tanacetum coccineum]
MEVTKSQPPSKEAAHSPTSHSKRRKRPEAGDPTSLGVASEERAHPQLSSGMFAYYHYENIFLNSTTFHSDSASGYDALVDSTAKVDPEKPAPNDFIPQQQGMNEGTKNTSSDHVFLGTDPSVLVDQTQSVRDGLKTTHTSSGTNKESRNGETSSKMKLEDLSQFMHDTRSDSLAPNSLDEPIIVSDVSDAEEDAEANTSTHDAAHDKPEDIPASHPSSPNSVQLQELKDQGMEIKLPRDLTDIPTKLETFTSTVSSLTSQVANTLTRFASIMENTSYKAKGKGVPSAGPTTASPAKGEKNTNLAIKDAETTNLHNELVDLLGIDIGPITLQVYMEDKIIEVISNVKVNDLHLAEWKEVVQAYPDRKEKGWKTIYGLIKARMEYLNQTEKELKIDFNKPLKEQYPLNELNDLANKKMKRTGDLKDHSRSIKKHKSSVQHEEEIH